MEPPGGSAREARRNRLSQGSKDFGRCDSPSLSALFWFALDQISKWVVLYQMDLLTIGQMEIFPPYLNFRMGWNTGVNFGLLANDADATRWLLVALAFVISAWILWWSRQMHKRIFDAVGGRHHRRGHCECPSTG